MRWSGRYCVYLVQCRDGTYYAGATNDLEKRLKLHNAGHGAKYVRGREPVRVVYRKACRGYRHALRVESALKQRTRKQKEELVRRFQIHRRVRW